MTLRRRLGLHVRELRWGRRWTQQQLASRSRLSVDAVRRVERGTLSPSLATIYKLASGLGVSLPTLFAGLEDGRRDPVAELEDFLQRLTQRELRVAKAVLLAMFLP